jgi:hypothetical protein
MFLPVSVCFFTFLIYACMCYDPNTIITGLINDTELIQQHDLHVRLVPFHPFPYVFTRFCLFLHVFYACMCYDPNTIITDLLETF